MNFIKKLIYKRKRKLVAKRIEQRISDKISIDCLSGIVVNIKDELVEKINYGYKYKHISIIRVMETDMTQEGTEEYFLLSIDKDKIKSKHNEKIYNLLKTKWKDFANERIANNIQSI